MPVNSPVRGALFDQGITLERVNERHAVATTGRTVRELAEMVPVLPYDAPLSTIVDVCLSDDANDWLVLVDGDEAVRLVDRAAVVRGEPFEHLASVVAATASVEDCARRVLDRPRGERLWPLVCEGLDGRAYGLIRIERLLEALTESSNLRR